MAPTPVNPTMPNHDDRKSVMIGVAFVQAEIAMSK
jgi:hypothetical protein